MNITDPSPPPSDSKFSWNLSKQTPELSEDLREFVRLLADHHVEFVVIGGYALAFHGHPRYTKDIDFFVRASRENAEKLEALIRDFGFESIGLRADDFYDPDVVVHLGHEPNRIELITRIDGVSFEEVWSERVPAVLDGIPVAFISRDHFLRNKRAAGRPKDLADAYEVESLGD